MKYAYLDTDNTVRAVSSIDIPLEDVQEDIPEVIIKISNTPEQLVGKESDELFWHHKIGGDGTHLIDYEQIDNLVKYKLNKNTDIDKRTREIITLGIPYDGHIFSQDIPDQLTYIFLYTAVVANQISYPIEIRDMDDIAYYLNDANAFYAFYFTGGAYIQNILASGRTLKNQVNDCTSSACINAIIDPR